MSLAALALTSCTQTELIDTNAGAKGMIDYALYAGRPTRAAELNNGNFTKFKIYAYQNIEAVLNGGTFTFSDYYDETVEKGSGTWSGPRPRRWPEKANDYLNFYAYSDETNVSNYVPTTAADAHPNFTYAVPVAAADQQDLLVSAAFNQTERTNQGKLNLDFKHALTQVAFKVKSASPSFEVKVSKVELIGANSAGKFTYDDNATVGAWSGQETPTDYAFDVETPAKVNNTDFVLLTAAAGNLMMIPNADPKDIKIRVTYTLDDETEVLTKEVKLETESATAGDNQPAITPVTAWAMGKRITYNLTLPGKANEIIFGDATTEDWDVAEDETNADAKEIFGVSAIDVSGMQKKNQSGFLLEINDNRQTAGTFSLTSDQPWVKFSETENNYAGATATLNNVAPATRANVAKKIYVYTDNSRITRTATITMTRADYSTVTIDVKQAIPESAEAEISGANCYVINDADTYALNATIKGNGKQVKLPVNYDAVTNPATDIPVNAADVNITGATKAEVLWETVNTGSAPSMGAIVKDVVLSGDGKTVFFTTTGTEGNAVIVVKDAADKVLWSWHIWRIGSTLEAMTKELKSITATAGTFADGTQTISGMKIMDRNLGALSATANNLSTGMLYQWGRKDPFPGAMSIALNTTTLMSVVGTEMTKDSNGSILAAVENPSVFYTGSDWTDRNDNLWGTPLTGNEITINNGTTDLQFDNNPGSKTIYDPCPKGWRIGASYSFSNASVAKGGAFNQGYNYNIVTSGTVYFPLTGILSAGSGALGSGGQRAYYRFSTPNVKRVAVGDYMYITNNTTTFNSVNDPRACGMSVRCVKE